MEALKEFFTMLGVGGSTAFILIIVFLLLQIVGEICEKCGKIVPEIAKVRKYFKRKKQEKLDQDNLMLAMKKAIDEFNKHYDPENIKQRDAWMNKVNEDRTWMHTRAVEYDNSIAELKADFAHNRTISNKLYVQNCRTTILDFAAKIAQPNYLTTRDEFRRVFKVYDEYEEFLEEIGEENGEIEDAIEVIRAIHKECLKQNKFLDPKKY